MRNYKDTRLSDDFVNMTDRIIYMYDQVSGEIIEFAPSAQTLPTSPVEEVPGAKIIHYIFELEDVICLEKTGRKLDDIAIIFDESYGRNSTLITYLVWGKDTQIAVCLYRNLSHANITHL
ncbi:hypothetical protein IKF21_02170 [Candidatus Saccharibacteria bacterium]|nr:hypothetical protein [Candidatus Saccharibacteria bacterium]